MNNIDWKRLASFSALMEKVEILDNGCWIYPSPTRGQVRFCGSVIYVHRLSYILWYGLEIEPGLVIRHLCYSNGKCINPEHLEPGTPLQNTADRKYPPVLMMIKRLKELGYKVNK